MSPFEYRQREEPGCGGCLLLLVLLIFLTGGAPLLFRVIGVFFYLFLFFALGALALVLGGGYFIRSRILTYERSQTETHNEFVSLLVHILVKIAQIDGQVTREEISTIRRFFQEQLRYSQSQQYWVKDLIKEAMESTVEMEKLLEEFRGKFAYEPRLLLLNLIYQVLFSNSTVSERELEMVRKIARFLGISIIDQRITEAQFTGAHRYGIPRERDNVKERRSLELLGLEPGADFAQIKTSYRRLSMKYHPDKVRHLGEEFRTVAEEKMKDLNQAYEFLEKKYGQQ